MYTKGSSPKTTASEGIDAGTAVLKLPDGREHEIKVLKPTAGDELFLDIRDLYAKTGYFTFDPGFTCTGSCMSEITYIDGPQGVCLYRGYPVQELCEHAKPLQVAYLLLVGDLPDPVKYDAFRIEVKKHMLVHEKVRAMYANFTINAHPMAIMVAVVGALSCVYSELDSSNPEHRWLACMRCIAQVPVLACMAYKTSIGQPMMYPKANFTLAENFLYMMFATPMEEYVPNKTACKAIEAFWILHMDHEQNASTSTVRIAGSSQANPYACIAAGVASLWGPAHGGANEAVILMLENIGRKENIPQFVADVKAKKEGVRLMGFGHRVYKNYDPRARFMKKLVQQVLTDLEIEDPLLDVAKELEKVALQDEYFLKRKLYPNVDYYSGIMLRALGIPTSMFTVMFAMARTVGWVSQWNEMVSEGQMRIGRPRQLYVGVGQRAFTEKTNITAEESLPTHIARTQSFSSEQALQEASRRPSGVLGFLSKLRHVDTR